MNRSIGNEPARAENYQMKRIATFSFSKNSDMETHARIICGTSFPDIRFIRHTRIFNGVRAGDAVFLMSHGLKSFLLLATCVLLRKPLFCQIHDETPHPGFKYPIIFLLNWILVRLSRLTIYFSSPERFSRFPHCVVDLPSVVAPDIAPIKPPEVWESWNGYLVFGRCETYKYTEDFMQAVREDDAYVVFAGRGWSSIVCSTNKITVVDRFISNEELAWLIKRSKAILLPYSSATQSGVAPIIATLGGLAVVKQDMARLNTQLARYGTYGTVLTWRQLFKAESLTLVNCEHPFCNAQPDHYAKQIHNAITSEYDWHR